MNILLKLSSFILLLGVSGAASGQILLTSGTSYVQNFDSVSGLTLPDGWRASYENSQPTWASAATSATYAASGGTPTAGGVYLWEQTGTTDQALGVMQGTTGISSILFEVKNAGPNVIGQIELSFDFEQYTENNDDTNLSLYQSSNGVAWTLVSSLGTTTHHTMTTVYSFAPPFTAHKDIVFSSILDPDQMVYLRLQINPGRAGVGFDNVTLSAVPEPPSICLLGIGAFWVGFSVFRRKFVSTARR